MFLNEELRVFQYAMWEELKHLTLERPIPVGMISVAMLLNAYILFYIHKYLTPGDTSRTFGYFIQIILVWQSRDLFYRLSASETTAAYWENVFSMGYVGFPALGLLFALKYTGFQKLAKKPWMIFLLFIPVIFFNSVYGLDTQSVKYYYSPFWGWYYTNNQTRVGFLMILWIFFCAGLTVVLLARFAWKSRHIPVLSTQSLLLTLGLGIPFLQACVTQFLLTQVLKLPGIPLGSSTLALFSVSTLIALYKFELFQVRISHDSSVIMEYPPVAELTVSSEINIIRANKYASNELDIYPYEIGPVSLDSILWDNKKNKEQMREILAECITQNIVTDREMVFVFKEHGAQSVMLSAKPVYSEDKLDYILLVWRMPIKPVHTKGKS